MWTAFIVIAFGVLLCGAVLFGVALYAQRRPQQVDPNGTTVSVPAVGGGANAAARKLVVPSAAFVQSMRAHVESRRIALAKLLKMSQDMRKLWAAKSEAERRSALIEQRDEVRARVASRPERHADCDSRKSHRHAGLPRRRRLHRRRRLASAGGVPRAER